MGKKRPPANPRPEQLVFPFELRVGDIIEEEGTRAEVVERPTGLSGGKMTRVWLRRDGDSVKTEVVWEAWRRIRVIRPTAA